MPSTDPRLRRAYDRLAQHLELANERTQEALFYVSSTYISPCLASIQTCTAQTCCCCCSLGEDDWRRRQRERARLRGRAEFSFDFYDDLEDAGEADALLGLASSSGAGAGLDDGFSALDQQQQPRRTERHMNYGSARQASHRSLLSAGAAEDDGTKNIPSSSYFGFLDKLPFKIGTKGFKYRPSIADLQEQPAIRRRQPPPTRHREEEEEEETEPLLAEDEDGDEDRNAQRRRRARRDTHTSRYTTDSLSSRGDIFPSEDEMDDAVPLDVEYALALERRSTNQTSDESTRSGKRLSATRSGSQRSTRSVSSTGSARQSQRQAATIQNYPSVIEPKPTQLSTPSIETQADPLIFKSGSIPSTAPLDSMTQESECPSPSFNAAALPRF